MYYQKLLYSIAVTLFLTGLYTVSEMPFGAYVVHTMITSLIFTLVSFYIGCYKHKIAAIIMLLFVVFDMLTIFAEIQIIIKIAIVVRATIFLLLCSLIVKKINVKARSYSMILIFSTIALLNGYLVYLLISSVDIHKFGFVNRAFFIIPSIIMIVMCVFSANYNFNRFHLRSTLFLLATFCIAFADISMFCGYFLEFKYMFYLERFFTVSAFLTFVNYVMLENKKRAQNSVEKSVYYY
ncbi:hypothetical protein [Lacinutrix sp. Bg11-31]|uniref:hypothetical protein n=1 Tax=Lacinutrix sp. Bg11-31 TaxID=2057808 RepID=UPI000C30F30A|nr:hypothetical protein [Lacinutrix sp. Bg11-31]AUC82219.1 hypothetical protein CW733_08795 [Lacinutrix sp. Bg11-31]